MSITKELESFTKAKHPPCKVTVLPDFFLDRLINLSWNPEEFSGQIQNVVDRKGGSLDGIQQTDMHGGNAVNVASALASLGAEVTPIVCTSKHGLNQLKYYFKDASIDMSHTKVHKRASITTALEFRAGQAKNNVMIRDLGSLAEFGPSNLNEEDFRAIEEADYTCLFNWAGTRHYGTELAESVFACAKKGRKPKTYYDTADPTPNKTSIPNLIGKVLRSSKIDILGLNENEAITYASFFDRNFVGNKKMDFEDLAMEAGRILAKHLQARIDLHTTAFSATLRAKKEVMAPTFKVNVLRATGAGDAWTAGNIIGDHQGLSDENRLTLANAVSACYLSDPEGKHPTWKTLAKFLKEH